MKITDLQLERYGIYRDVSWEPPQNQLIVVMGENESGKTTLLNFIRDMLFGYRRGMWQDRSGNMGFLRGDGEFSEYTGMGKKAGLQTDEAPDIRKNCLCCGGMV